MDAPSQLVEVDSPTIPPALHIRETFIPSDECDVYDADLIRTIILSSRHHYFKYPNKYPDFLCRFHIRHQEPQWTLSIASSWKPMSTDHLGNFHFPTTLTALQISLPKYLFHALSQCLDTTAGIFHGVLWPNLKASKKETLLDWEVQRRDKPLSKESVS